MTDHTRAARDGYAPVFAAREQWLSSGSAADKARFDAAAADYSARFDCSCESNSSICNCVYTPATPHSDATEPVYRSDTHSQELSMPKSPTFKSDAEAAMRERNLTAWCAPLAATKENARDGQHRVALVGERVARADALTAELKQYREARDVRMDAKMPPAPESIVDKAERQMRERSRTAYLLPLQCSSHFPGGPKDAA